jgi:hypothetical protein
MSGLVNEWMNELGAIFKVLLVQVMRVLLLGTWRIKDMRYVCLTESGDRQTYVISGKP